VSDANDMVGFKGWIQVGLILLVLVYPADIIYFFEFFVRIRFAIGVALIGTGEEAAFTQSPRPKIGRNHAGLSLVRKKQKGC